MIEVWGIEHVHELAEMIKYTEQRKNIHLRNEDYFRTIMENFGDQSASSPLIWIAIMRWRSSRKNRKVFASI